MTENINAMTDNDHQAPDTLNAAVRRRRGDAQFYLRLRDAIVANRRALERLGR